MNRVDKRLVIENIEIYNYYFERLVNLALSQFEWHFTDDEINKTFDRRYFERNLLFNGTAALLQPRGTDFWMSLGYVTRGKFNAYGWPAKIDGITFNGKQIRTDKFEICYDNMSYTTLIPKIKLYAKLLYEVHQVFRSNLQQQITPYLIPTTKKKSLSMSNIMNRITGFDPVIQLKQGEDIDEVIKTLDTRVDFRGNEMMQALKTVWAEALSMLGITAETTKKERLIEGELVMNRQEDILSLNSRLYNRVDFCNRLKRNHGIEATVNLTSQDLEFRPFGGDYAMQTLEKTGADEGEATARENREDNDG